MMPFRVAYKCWMILAEWAALCFWVADDIARAL